tara:strand:- start:505 stop:1026 length:522 start_codon:yes stop_codon:yes gene_type:complete
MPELSDLPAIDPADVTDDDFILIFDNSAPVTKSKKASRSNFLKDVAREGGDHNFGTSEIETLTANDATIVNLNVTTSMQFDTAATLQKMYRATASIVTAGTAAGASETLTATISGVLEGDFVNLSFAAALPDGLMAQAWVSASDTISVKFYNATTVAIAGATFSAKLAVMRFA